MFRFEPHGQQTMNMGKNINEVITTLLRENIVFANQFTYEESIGPQDFEMRYIAKFPTLIKSDGLCLVYTIWFVELILRNPNAPLKEILNYMVKDSPIYPLSVMIRQYLQYLIDMYNDLN